jgi:ElaB/YqjD/DUF883 family membrane-anchored ribosome-binding protein
MTFQTNRIAKHLNDLAQDGRNRMAEIGGDIRRRGSAAFRRARHQFQDSGDALLAAEKTVVRSVKAHPLAYALVGVAVTSLVAAGLLFSPRLRRE